MGSQSGSHHTTEPQHQSRHAPLHTANTELSGCVRVCVCQCVRYTYPPPPTYNITTCEDISPLLTDLQTQRTFPEQNVQYCCILL